MIFWTGPWNNRCYSDLAVMWPKFVHSTAHLHGTFHLPVPHVCPFGCPALTVPTYPPPSWLSSPSSRCWRVNSWLGLLLASAPHCAQPFWSLPRPCTARWLTKSQTRFALSAVGERWRKLAGDSMDTRGSGQQDGQKERGLGKQKQPQQGRVLA